MIEVDQHDIPNRLSTIGEKKDKKTISFELFSINRREFLNFARGKRTGYRENMI